MTDETQVDDTNDEEPVIATYSVAVTIRGYRGQEGPTVKEVESFVRDALGTHWTARVRATRTDK